MAKRPGAGGIMLVAVVLGLITAYLVYTLVRDAQSRSKANWKPVIVATVDIPGKKTITRDMVVQTLIADENKASDALDDTKDVIGKISLEHIRVKDQIRKDMLAQKGQSSSLTYQIPAG